MSRVSSVVCLTLAFFLVSRAVSAQVCQTAPKLGDLWYGSSGPHTCSGTSSTPSASPCGIGEKTTFTAVLTNSTACDLYTWNFDDGSAPVNGQSAIVDHTFTTVGNHTVSVTVSNSLGSSSMSASVRTFLGYVEASGGTFTEGSIAVITISRDYSVGSATVDYATRDASAKANINYTPVSGTLSFANGEQSKSINVPLLDDHVYTGRQDLLVVLSNASSGYDISFAAQISINDITPPPTIRFAAPVYTIAENGSWQPITVTRSGDMTGTVRATYSFSGSGLQNTQSGFVVFRPNETSQVFYVMPLNDTVYTGTRSATIRLTFNNTPDETIVNVIDDEPAPAISVDDVDVVEGDSGEKSVTFTATLSAAMTTAPRLEWSTQDGSAA